MQQLLADLTAMKPRTDRSNVLDLEDPAIFRYPILYMSEPGYWSITEEGARNLRLLDPSHPVFHAFFAIDDIYVPHPFVRVQPAYYAMFEDDDPARRMLVLANHNADLAEYWEYSGTGFLPVDVTSEAWKLGINYIVYGLTH